MSSVRLRFIMHSFYATVLQCVAVWCSVWQYVAACCSMLQRIAEFEKMDQLNATQMCCSVWQRVAS